MYGCPPEIVRTLFIGYTPIQNKKLKKKKKTGVEVRNRCLQTIYNHVSTVEPGCETLLEEWCRVTVLLSQDWSGQRGPQHPTMLFRLVPSWANKERLGQYKEPRKRTRLKWCWIFLKHFLGPRMDLFQRWPPKTCGPFQRGVLQQRSYLANPLLTSKIYFFSVGK